MNFKAFLSASMLVMLGMVAGRLLGMLREMMMAAHFGTGHLGDMAITLLMIPDFITAALIGAAVSSALVPAFGARTPERALALLWQALAVSIAVFSGVVLLLSFKASWLLSQFNAPQAVPDPTFALVVAFASIPFSVATAVLTAYLQHKGKFLVPAFATVIFNLVIVGSLWFGADDLYLLSLSIFAASALRFAPHLLAFLRSETRHRPNFRTWELDRKLIKIYAAATGSGLLGLLPIYAPYAVIASLGGGIALFNYAFKLILLPGLLTQTVAQLVLLPWLVAKRKNAAPGAAMDRPVSVALHTAWLVSFSMALALSFAAQAIAALFFSYGKMQPEDIMQIGHLFALGVWALPGMLLTAVWQVIFFSDERAFPPLLGNLSQAVTILPGCWLGYRIAGPSGIVIAFAGVQSLSALLLGALAVRAKLSHARLPGAAYSKIVCMVGLVSLPFMLCFRAFTLGNGEAIALAMFCGSLSLVAGAMAIPTLRDALKTWISSRSFS